MASRKQNRKLVLSPTRISSWLECNLQYKFTYIDRISKFYYRPNRFDTFGATMHRTLQMFHEAGGPETVSKDKLLATLESCWTSTGYESEQEENQYRDLGAQIVDQYWLQSSSRPSTTLFIEKQLRHNYDTFAIMGRLDRLDEHSDKTLEIIDYKSGRTEITPEDVHSSLAMLCYSLLVHKHYPDRPVIATIIGLAGGCLATTQFTQDEMDVFEEDAHQIAGQIMGREEYLPGYGPHCAECIYTRICYKGWETVDWEMKQKEFEESQFG